MSPGINHCTVCLAFPSPRGWACGPGGGAAPRGGLRAPLPGLPCAAQTHRPTGRPFRKQSMCLCRRGVRAGVPGGCGGEGQGGGPTCEQEPGARGSAPCHPFHCALALLPRPRGARRPRVESKAPGSCLQPAEHCVSGAGPKPDCGVLQKVRRSGSSGRVRAEAAAAPRASLCPGGLSCVWAARGPEDRADF